MNLCSCSVSANLTANLCCALISQHFVKVNSVVNSAALASIVDLIGVIVDGLASYFTCFFRSVSASTVSSHKRRELTKRRKSMALRSESISVRADTRESAGESEDGLGLPHSHANANDWLRMRILVIFSMKMSSNGHFNWPGRGFGCLTVTFSSALIGFYPSAV